jgi:alpha,alpha-trehalase
VKEIMSTDEVKAIVHTPETELNDTFDHIMRYWRVLTRSGKSLNFPLPGRFVKPGGFFKWFFYWDSYFIILGLVVQGQWQLPREIVDNLIYEVEEFGHVPNYNSPRNVCQSRSQSPFLTAAISEVYPFIGDPAWLATATRAAVREYEGYWTVEPHLTKIGLSRYVDTGGNGCGTVPDSPHYRAISESGWDNTPRFGKNAVQVVPIDLNCQLCRYESDLSLFFALLGRNKEAALWKARYEERKRIINEYLWDETSGFYWDYDLRTHNKLQSTPRSLASFMPLWSGVADAAQANRLLEHLKVFEYDHGLVSCEKGWDDGTEHNYPTGWPYSHWYLCYGLRRYGFDKEATRIAIKYLRLLGRERAISGVLRERHNVVNQDEPVPGRYPPQMGFGWTNGVFVALSVRVIFGVEPDTINGGYCWSASFPDDWHDGEVYLELENFPWPEGIAKKFSSQ